MLEPGDSAPDFSLPNHEGDQTRLSDFAGQTVVLYFYPKAGTDGCTAEACSFRDSWDAFEERDVQVVGVSMDSVEENRTFREAEDLPFPLLSDEDGEVAREYDSFQTVVVDGEELEVASRNTFVIDEDGTVEAVYEGVSPDGHAEEILSEL